MRVNDKFISRLIGILEGASELGTANVRKMEDTGTDEYIVRYEDGNGITISIYFTDKDCCNVGYLDADARYRSFSSWARIDRANEAKFLFDLAILLHRCSEYAAYHFDFIED